MVDLDEDCFRQEIRMSRSIFDWVMNLMEFYPVYQNNSTVFQAPVQLQLLLTLHRLGCFRNGVSFGKVARRFGVSEGAASMFTDRTIIAIL